MGSPYVYALIDPRDGATFYIGKGNGRRMYQHENEVRRGKSANAAKSARISDIIAAGLKVACEVLARFKTDQEAYEAERAFIAKHAGLTNANAGGGGSFAGGAGSGEERQESPEVTLRKALALMNRIVPYPQWIQERPRSEDEIAARSWVFDQLAEIIAMCEAKLGIRSSNGSRRAGLACPV